MSSESIITLYDVPSDLPGTAWSGNVWKARYVLNYKRIPYKTTWLEYPEIEPTMRSIGAAPTRTKADGSPFYTLPVIVDPSRLAPSGGPMIVSESFAIAEYLDETYPSPRPLFPIGTKALQMLFYDHFYAITVKSVLLVILTTMYAHVNEASRPYWRRTRESWIGGKLEDVCPKGSKKWDEEWVEIEKAFHTLATLLDKNGADADTLVMGEQLTFADFTIAAFLEMMYLAHSDEWHSKIRTWDGGRWERFRDRCAEWRSVH